MNFEQYYPTPPALARQLVGKLKNCEYGAMTLEPSAGTGELVREYCRVFDCESRAIHCIEINEERAAMLRDRYYTVVWDDFMTFEPLMPYSKIIMNPPFHSGAKHLLKALQILADGGEIACILNAETIKNPFSRERRDLIRQLESMEEYATEFVKSAFDSTEVEVALVYGRKAKSKIFCPTLEKFKTWTVNEDTPQGNLFPAPLDKVDFLMKSEVTTRFL